MTDFKNIKRLGLSTVRARTSEPCKGGVAYQDFDFVRAEDLERLLEKGRTVFGYLTSDESECAKYHKTPWHVLEHFNEKTTHTALLIGIEPIKRESAEVEKLYELSKQMHDLCMRILEK